MTSAPNHQISRSVDAYSRVYRAYERRHPEIFNDIEQPRLRTALATALSEISTDSSPPLVLDLGCGSGNLTAILLEMGAQVLAADVSPDFLHHIEERFPHDRVRTLRLNGNDLRNVGDVSLDMVAMYSVLHHIPDYLAILPEAVRVLRPGGVVFIDHERNEDFWHETPCLQDFMSALRAQRASRLSWSALRRADTYRKAVRYARWRFHVMVNPRYQSEGDIHVFPDDHVEWDKVEGVLQAEGVRTVAKSDYLLFSADYDRAVWDRFKDRCRDTRLLIGRFEPELRPAPRSASHCV